MTSRKNQSYSKSGWAFVILGMSMTTVLTVLNTVLQDFKLIKNSESIIQQFKIEISGWVIGVPSILIVAGVILIMHRPIGDLIQRSKWGKK